MYSHVLTVEVYEQLAPCCRPAQSSGLHQVAHLIMCMMKGICNSRLCSACIIHDHNTMGLEGLSRQGRGSKPGRVKARVACNVGRQPCSNAMYLIDIKLHLLKVPSLQQLLAYFLIQFHLTCTSLMRAHVCADKSSSACQQTCKALP